MKNLIRLKKDFDELINNIPNYLNELKQELNLDELRFNHAEVDLIESWISEKIKTNESSQGDENKFEKMFFSYCSTAFIQSNGGEIVLDKKKNSFTYGEPIIINYGGYNYPWVAISIFGWIRIIKTRGLKRPLRDVLLRNLKNISN